MNRCPICANILRDDGTCPSDPLTWHRRSAATPRQLATGDGPLDQCDCAACAKLREKTA